MPGGMRKYDWKEFFPPVAKRGTKRPFTVRWTNLYGVRLATGRMTANGVKEFREAAALWRKDFHHDARLRVVREESDDQ